jgi:hypothetical protein
MFPKFTIPRNAPKSRRAPAPGDGSTRDVALLTRALGTGLRLREIRGLNVWRRARGKRYCRGSVWIRRPQMAT